MNWFREIFSDAVGQMSSKRVCGVIGFFISVFVLVYCTIKVIEAPTMIDAFLLFCGALLGVDSVTSIWKGNKETKTEE